MSNSFAEEDTQEYAEDVEQEQREEEKKRIDLLDVGARFVSSLDEFANKGK